jgi:hypothetical protein
MEFATVWALALTIAALPFTVMKLAPPRTGLALYALLVWFYILACADALRGTCGEAVAGAFMDAATIVYFVIIWSV